MELGIGKRILKRRTELGLTQLELALRMGYKSKAAICKVEGGEDNITTDRIKKFADALECTPAYIMGWETADYELSINEKIIIETYRNDNNYKEMIDRLTKYAKEINNAEN